MGTVGIHGGNSSTTAAPFQVVGTQAVSVTGTTIDIDVSGSGLLALDVAGTWTNLQIFMSGAIGAASGRNLRAKRAIDDLETLSVITGNGHWFIDCRGMDVVTLIVTFTSGSTTLNWATQPYAYDYFNHAIVTTSDGVVNATSYDAGSTWGLKVDASHTQQPVIMVPSSSVQLTPISGTASSSGPNTLITPASGNSLSLYYLSYNPSAPVTLSFHFGAPPYMLKNDIVVGGSIIAKDFGDLRCVRGGTDQSLYLELSAAVSTNWNVFYVEIT